MECINSHSDLKFHLANKIKTARKAKGFTQKDFAKKINISVPTYSNYENGYSEPNIYTLTKIAKGLGTSVDELVGLELEQKESIDEVTKKIFRKVQTLDNTGKEVTLNFLNSIGKMNTFNKNFS